MNKQTTILATTATLALIFLIAFVLATLRINNLDAQLTQTKEAHMACQEIARGYITSTSSVLPAISAPSLYTRQQAQIAIQSAQDIATTYTDSCLEQ